MVGLGWNIVVVGGGWGGISSINIDFVSTNNMTIKIKHIGDYQYYSNSGL